MSGKRSEWRFYFWMVACVSTGAIGILCPDHLVAGFGEALLIAGLLGLTVDTFVKRQLAAQVSKDVLTAALGFHLPMEIRDQIREICSCKVVRYDLEIRYKIRPMKASPQIVMVESEVSYRAENKTDNTQAFNHLIWVQKPFEPKPGFRQIYYAKATGIQGTLYELKDGEIEAKEDKKEFGVSWERETQIPPQGTISIWSHSRQLLPREHIDLFTLVHPSVGAKVRVDAPNNYQIAVTFNHHRNCDAEPSGGNQWSLRSGFVPYSTISIEWRLKTLTSR